jgi:flagellar biogenesis protein FliO
MAALYKALAPMPLSTGIGTQLAHGVSSQSMIWQYMTSVGLYSAVVIGILLAFLWWVRRNPNLGQSLRSLAGFKPPASPEPSEQPKLQIEEAMALTADTQLLIVKCLEERFLVSAGPDGLKLLTKLDTGQKEHDQAELLRHLYDESTTFEDASGIRGRAITPTESGETPDGGHMGVTIPSFPNTIKHFKPSFMVEQLKGMIPQAESSSPKRGWGDQTPPPFGPNHH